MSIQDEPEQQINVWLPQSAYEDLKNIQHFMPGATLKNLIVEAASNHIETIKKTHPELLENGVIKSREKAVPMDFQSMRLPVALIEKIRRHSYWARVSISSIYRDALENYVNNTLEDINAEHMKDGEIKEPG